MFYRDGILTRSDVLAFPGVRAGFSSRAGGMSTLPHTATLNLAEGLGDDAETVRRNKEIFARAVSAGEYGGETTVAAHQIHSSRVRILTQANAGEGFGRPAGEDGDGFVTAEAGVMPIIRTADCAPILFAGLREDGTPVIAAVHAGWRGTVAGIAAEAVRVMHTLGCETESIRAAIGPRIGFCCYEVGEDFAEAVRQARGSGFAGRHIRRVAGVSDDARPHADLAGMNLEILAEAGIAAAQVDVSPACTMCDERYYSHRRMHGVRGVMGAGIVISAR
ncbi:MAG: peptidoglycan editing factor PgeF [Clostridiales bacterium]|nr:peptidoglycan editing factor PgeF [Clostridiales bacterium]